MYDINFNIIYYVASQFVIIQAAEHAGDDLSSRLVKQGAQYFSANEGESDSDADDRSTLQPDHYVVDPDQPKLALAEESVQPSPAIEKHPPSPREEYRGIYIYKKICVHNWLGK